MESNNFEPLLPGLIEKQMKSPEFKFDRYRIKLHILNQETLEFIFLPEEDEDT